MVSCTAAVEASSAWPIAGSDGRYMSMVSGPSAVSSDSSRVSAKVPGWSMKASPMCHDRTRRAAARQEPLRLMKWQSACGRFDGLLSRVAHDFQLALAQASERHDRGRYADHRRPDLRGARYRRAMHRG